MTIESQVALDAQAPTPLYLQLEGVLKREIERGRWKPGEALPPEREMASLLGVSRITLRRALDLLEQQHILVRRQGSGTFLSKRIELPIALDSGPEVIAGSTRLAAGTAQKVALNVFSTLVMVQLGRTYGNKMVALRAANQKLEVRAARIIAELSGADLETAAAMFGETRDVRVAVLRLKGYGPEEARRLASEQPLRELL